MNEPRLPRLSGQGGFTLATAMGIMLIASLVCIAAFQAANGDVLPSSENSNRKQAYEAAESGVAWYQSKLTSDPNYWQLCDTGTTNGVADPVTQPNATNRKWATLSGTGVDVSDFTIAVIPASGSTCSTSDPSTMLSTVDGSFKVRATGRYRGQKRSITASFRRQRFLDFLYFTDYETLDPAATGSSLTCAAYRASRSPSCTAIQFASGDKVNGPLHTNDDLIYCGSPTFGRTSSDNIHVSGPAPGYAPNGSGCGPGPIFNGTFRSAQRQLQLPPSNSALKPLTTTCCTGSGYLLKGTQYIRFTGATMVIDTPSGNPKSVALPSNGVIYVDDNGCSAGVNTIDNEAYTESEGCANVYVSGTANSPITLASQRDIIVAPTTAYLGTNTSLQFDPATAGSTWADADLNANGSLDPTTQQLTGNVQIGLIADRFVRVYHRVSSNALASGVRNVRIDAAILSLQHSFIVDNWNEAPSPGTLQVHGAIAQRFRGTVGTGSGGSISTGYVKDYWYDNRLKYRSPPYFLDPVNSAWTLGRETELVPPV